MRKIIGWIGLSVIILAIGIVPCVIKLGFTISAILIGLGCLAVAVIITGVIALFTTMAVS